MGRESNTARYIHHGRGVVPAAHPAGLKTRSVLAGYLLNNCAGRRGRITNSPPQFGQRPCSVSAQLAQKVHSNVQIIASAACGGRSRSQHSQLGRSCSMAQALAADGEQSLRSQRMRVNRELIHKMTARVATNHVRYSLNHRSLLAGLLVCSLQQWCRALP